MCLASAKLQQLRTLDDLGPQAFPLIDPATRSRRAQFAPGAIAAFRTAQNAHFGRQSPADTSARGESGDSNSLPNRGCEPSWPGIRPIQLQHGFRLF